MTAIEVGEVAGVRREGEDADNDADSAWMAAAYPALRRFAAVVAPSEVEPDDLVQEAVARAIRRQPLTALENPGAYLRTAMVRLAANHRRSLGRRRMALVRLQRLARDRFDAEHRSVGLAVLDHLSATDRAVVYLSVVEDLDVSAVAVMLGLSDAAVRGRKHRALRRLRRLVDEESPDV